MIHLIHSKSRSRSDELRGDFIAAALDARNAAIDVVWSRNIGCEAEDLGRRERAQALCEQALRSAEREGLITEAGVRRLTGVVIDAMRVAEMLVTKTLPVPVYHDQVAALRAAIIKVWREETLKRRVTVALRLAS